MAYIHIYVQIFLFIPTPETNHILCETTSQQTSNRFTFLTPTYDRHNTEQYCATNELKMTQYTVETNTDYQIIDY